MCPYSLDGELPHVPEGPHGNEYPFGLLVQFSSSVEAGGRAFRPRSLETEQRHPASRAGRRSGRHSGFLPRKEVIQPQLPLRLPCYDFTPITSPTFDGCLPEG
jgi:hypothetical protein